MKFASATFIAVITAPTAFPAKAEDRKGTTLVGGAGPLARTGDGRGGEEEAHRAAGAVAAQAREKDAGRRRLEEPCDCEIEPPACEKGFIECVDGKVAGGQSCYHACTDSGGECCKGRVACDGFTGKVCPDGSCGGSDSCKDARIDYVVNSCKNIQACKEAGAGGSIASMVDSCNDDYACEEVEARNIVQSCNRGFACKKAKIDEIVESCNDSEACYDASIGGGTFCSCNGARACYQGTAAGDDPLVECCNGNDACIFDSPPGQCDALCPASENPSEAPSTQPSEQASESQLPTWSHPMSKSGKSGKRSKQGKDGKGAKKDRSKRVKKVKAAKKAKMDLWAGVPADEWTMAALIQDEEGMAALADPDVGCLSFEYDDKNELVRG